MLRSLLLSLLCLLWAGLPQAQPAIAALPRCGEVVSLETHERSSTRYALALPSDASWQRERVALVLLAGGGGHVSLDERGCARALVGNSLVRSTAEFHRAGFATAVVDAPSDHPGEDGLAGFRITPDHAKDLGLVIADVRARTGAAVWLVGTSRGTISAVNAAARLAGPMAPNGLVLTSALMSGFTGGRKPWVAQTVFDLPLEAIQIPTLVIGHAADRCIRSPASLMGQIVERTNGAREQVVVVSGGPHMPGPATANACEGRSAHGFIDQEAEVVAGMARFIRGARY